MGGPIVFIGTVQLLLSQTLHTHGPSSRNTPAKTNIVEIWNLLGGASLVPVKHLQDAACMSIASWLAVVMSVECRSGISMASNQLESKAAGISIGVCAFVSRSTVLRLIRKDHELGTHWHVALSVCRIHMDTTSNL